MQPILEYLKRRDKQVYATKVTQKTSVDDFCKILENNGFKNDTDARNRYINVSIPMTDGEWVDVWKPVKENVYFLTPNLRYIYIYPGGRDDLKKDWVIKLLFTWDMKQFIKVSLFTRYSTKPVRVFDKVDDKIVDLINDCL